MSVRAKKLALRNTIRTVYVPSSLAWQKPVLADEHRFKLLRIGRRGGKSRLSFKGCVLGHGPVHDRQYDMPDGTIEVKRERLWKGLVHKAQLAWVSPDYPQSKAIWDEEIVPRFTDVMGAYLDEGDRVLHFMGGTLEFVSAENIDSRRGRKYDGVVLDEGAHFDLEYAWQRVIRATLIDKRGWAIIPSTPDVGSFFNLLCKQVMDGERGPNWHLPSNVNERLSPEEFLELQLEFPPDSRDALQEIGAELVEDLGELFKPEYFQDYTFADKSGMMVGGVWHPFVEIRMYVDLAASMKQTADYTCVYVVGLTAKHDKIRRKAGILHVHNEHLEGPGQIALFTKMIDEWHPHVTKIESNAYQITAVQHARAARPRARIEAVNVDKDKRTRAVPWAAAMARGDVFWPAVAPWKKLVVTQHLKFPNGDEDSPVATEHDDTVDPGSLLAADQLVITRRRVNVAPSVSYTTMGM